jgi:hypothetical protein
MSVRCLLDRPSTPARRCVVAATLECLQLAGRDSGDSVTGTLQSPNAPFLLMLLPTQAAACNPHSNINPIIADLS